MQVLPKFRLIASGIATRITLAAALAASGMLPASAQSVVSIDATAVTRFNNQVFFPLGVYTDNLTDGELQRLRDAGYNTVLSYSYGLSDVPTAQNFLDRAAAKNMKVIFSLKDFYEEEGYFPWSWKQTGDQLATTYVNALKKCPARLVYQR